MVGVEGMGNFTDIACGAHHSLAVGENGEAYGWGKNDSRQIASIKLGSI